MGRSNCFCKRAEIDIFRDEVFVDDPFRRDVEDETIEPPEELERRLLPAVDPRRGAFSAAVELKPRAPVREESRYSLPTSSCFCPLG